MSAAQVIEEKKHLAPAEQVKVIQFAMELAQTRPLGPPELTTLAQRLADSDDPAEVERLKTSLTRGFYAEWACCASAVETYLRRCSLTCWIAFAPATFPQNRSDCSWNGWTRLLKYRLAGGSSDSVG